MRFDEQHNGDQVDLSSGIEFDVSLTKEPTTGFRWRVDSTGAPACRLCDDTFHASASSPGGGAVTGTRTRAVRC